MTDLSTTIAPKSDQLNADDLIAEPRTIKITKIAANPSSAEQPISVFFEGDRGKPYKPCKSMRRVFVHVWGKDGTAYVGRSLTLFRDPKVLFGGVEVGGIRISHMSDIDRDVQMSLTVAKAARKPYVVKPLRDGWSRPTRTWNDVVAAIKAVAEKASSSAEAIALRDLDDVMMALDKGGEKVVAAVQKILSDAATRFPPSDADDGEIEQGGAADDFDREAA